MTVFYFILGKNPALSIAEIFNFLKLENVKFDTINISDSVLKLRLFKEIDSEYVINKLGGVIKIVKKLDFDYNTDLLTQYIANQSLKNDKKMIYRISVYCLDNKISLKKLKNISKKIEAKAMDVKRLLKNLNVKSRFVSGFSKESSSAVIINENLIESGSDINVFLTAQGDQEPGYTVAVQDIKEYGFLDYARPYSDPYKGMLPPKLAKIMINIGLKKIYIKTNILDPFCGMGTVLMESFLLGIKNIYGADKDIKAIEKTKTNLNWVKKNYPSFKADIKLYNSDVKTLKKNVSPNLINCIVTEPFLGDPLRKKITYKEAVKRQKKLADLYLDAFFTFKKILKNNGTVVFVLPVVYLGKNDFNDIDKSFNNNYFVFVDIIEKIKKTGFNQVDIIKNFKNYDIINIIKKRKSILYKRAGQKILREIIKFEKCKG